MIYLNDDIEHLVKQYLFLSFMNQGTECFFRYCHEAKQVAVTVPLHASRR